MTSPLTIVSGYWIVTNKHGNKFLNWFKKSLKINCPYVFFGTKETIAIAKEHRGTLPTHYIELELADFFTKRYRDDFQTDAEHCPSKELNMIWNEKLFLMQKAAHLNPYKSDFFAWVDAGITNYRNKAPPTTVFPDPAKLKTLPKDKLIFSASGRPGESHRILSFRIRDLYGTQVIYRRVCSRICTLYEHPCTYADNHFYRSSDYDTHV